MRVVLDCGWLHVDVTFGPAPAGGEVTEQRDSTLDALVERSDPAPDPRAELDTRPLWGFRGTPK